MDDFHFIEEMFSNPIGFILVLDFFDFGSEFSGRYIFIFLFFVFFLMCFFYFGCFSMELIFSFDSWMVFIL